MTAKAGLISLVTTLSLMALADGTLSAGSARAEENCLAAPNSRAPQGSHWYYRTDPTSQNKCWHLRAEGQTDAQSIRQEKQEQTGPSAAAR